MNGLNLTKFSICIDIDVINVGMIMLNISQICNGVMAIGSSQNFFPAQYLKNEWLLFYKKFPYTLMLIRSWRGLFCFNL